MRQQLSNPESSHSSANSEPSRHEQESIDETTIHTILQNSRRRVALRELTQTGSTMSVRELSELIAEAEAERSPPPRDLRRSIYTTLIQTHLNQLESAGFVDYDEDRKDVRATDAATKLAPFTADLRGNGRRRRLIAGGTLALVVLSLIVVTGVWVTVPGLSALLAAIVALAAASITAAYQLAGENRPTSWQHADR